jgi:hypothetical protein
MEGQLHIHKSQIRRANRIFNRAKKASRKMAAYSEELSEDGLAELLLFCVVVGLVNEDDMLVKQLAVSALYSFLSSESSISLSGEKLQKHILVRSEYFLWQIKDITADPKGADLCPLYSAFFRDPLTNIQFSVAEPKDPESFRKVVNIMILKLSRLF